MPRSERAKPVSEGVAGRPGSTARLIAIGALTGLYSGFLGLGGGFILVPMLTRWLGFDIKRAIATSLLAITILAIPGTITHAVLGNIDWRIAAVLAVGVIPGAILGSRLTLGSAERSVRIGFATLLLVTGAWLAISTLPGRPDMRSRLREAHAREATRREAESLWPAARAERIFDTAEQFAAYCDAAPWRIRVSERGDAAILGVWREHLDVLAMRGVFCSPRHIGAFVADARALAAEHGLGRVLSPLLPVDLLGPYRQEGMSVCQRIIPIQGHPRAIPVADLPLGVTLRAGRTEDLARLVLLDAECFDDFWRYGPS